MTRPLNVLVPCTGNAPRNIMAESRLNSRRQGRFFTVLQPRQLSHVAIQRQVDDIGRLRPDTVRGRAS